MERTTVGRTAVLAGAVLALGSLVLPAGAGVAPATLTVGPDPAHPGDTITIGNSDGSECDGGVAEFEVLLNDFVVIEQPAIPPDADGDWSRSVELPEDAELGIYEVEAECVGGGAAQRPSLPAPFAYQNTDFEVVAPPVEGDFTFTVTPTSGLAGSSVHVSGAFCSPGLGDAVVVTFTAPNPHPVWDPATGDAAGVFTVGPPDASYAGDFDVPMVASGQHQVNGFCVGEGGQMILPPLSVPFVVLARAEPPSPVVVTPTFTG